MKTVRLDGVNHSFPDDASDEEISQALEAMHPAGPTGSMGAGHDVEGAFGEQDPKASAIFPTAKDAPLSADQTGQNPATGRSYGPPSGAAVLPVAEDLYNVPTRAAATSRGMEMSDPNAYYLRPEVEAQEKAPAPYPNPFANQNFAGTSEMSGRTASDPVGALLFAFSGLGKVGLAALEKAAPGISKAAEALHRWSGRSAEKLSGVPLETLEAYKDPAKRAAMKAAHGTESEIGKEFLDKFRDPEAFLTEGKKLKEISKDLPNVNSQSAVDAMESALPKPVQGFAPGEIGAYTDVERSAIGKAQSNIDFIRGGKRPEDLAENVSRAGQRASDAEIQAAALEAQANQEAKAASQANRSQQSTQSKAAKAAAQAGKTKKQFLGDADKADKNKLRWGGARDEAGQAAESALEEAQVAAVKAREAATDARAKVALGEISKADFASAKATAEAAESNLELLTVAERLHSGAPLKVVAGELSKQGKSVEQIRDILTRARDRANSVVQPKTDHVFDAYWDKRRRLDSDIDFGKASDALVDKVNKAGRNEMMGVMERMAENSNHPEFKDLMKSYSRKAKLVDDLKAYIGQTKGANDRKIQQFFDHLFGKNSQHKQDLVAEMDKVMGTNTLEKARSAQQAQQIGHDGEAAWFPMHNTGAMGAGQQWLGRIGFLWSSPAVASRATLPAFAKVESLAKKIGSAIPPKASKLVAAIERADNPSKAAPLVNQLVQVLEAELPANAIPFRKKVADGEAEDNTRYSRK